jgi:predicted NBD/HSP70 family sugar kinase
MTYAVGVLAMEHIATGLVDGGRLAGPIRIFPDQALASAGALQGLHADQIGQAICDSVSAVAGSHSIDAVGVGFPGVIRNGIVEESPNLPQMKGCALARLLADTLGPGVPVHVLNDADAVAGGIAATRGQLDALTRVWTLGSGVGFGRHPQAPGIWEGGHIVVSLDPKESLCGCGGQGHLEGIVGHRSMRLRFLDLEPEEVFANAAAGDARCASFARLWHRALAAATATSVHLDGPGRFFLSGPNARFVDLAVLSGALQDMIKMSPLQGSGFEVIATSDEIAIVGAAVSARQAAARG